MGLFDNVVSGSSTMPSPVGASPQLLAQIEEILSRLPEEQREEARAKVYARLQQQARDRAVSSGGGLFGNPG